MKGPEDVVKKIIENTITQFWELLNSKVFDPWQDLWWIGQKQLLRLIDCILSTNYC